VLLQVAVGLGLIENVSRSAAAGVDITAIIFD
jgi:hypothetical protein